MDLKIRNTFRPNERLKSRKKIAALFDNPDSTFAFPIKMKYVPNEEGVLKIAVSIPKRLFKRAVDRNRLKRQILESFRINKSKYYNSKEEVGYNIMFIYVHNDIIKIEKIEKSMIELLNHLEQL